MKRNIVNFTRGSQLLGHFGFMFASGLKAPLIIAAVLLAGMSYWQVTSGLSDNQQYLVGMNLYASLLRVYGVRSCQTGTSGCCGRR